MIQGPNHALLCGEILGALWRAGLDASIVDDDHGVHTNQLIVVTRPSGTWSVLIEPLAVAQEDR